ncbi:hypothetical protein ACCQ10_01255 [Xanthomonas sp. NCPPB 1325]|uniref:hypothetical protein n=1 Tax=Xanthomonas sp. NCPPB 1325 TaxID=487529 RepID=UPI0035591266
MSGWTLADLPPQRARVAVITGASPGGLDYDNALASAGANLVLIACNLDKSEAAQQALFARYADTGMCVEWSTV